VDWRNRTGLKRCQSFTVRLNCGINRKMVDFALKIKLSEAVGRQSRQSFERAIGSGSPAVP
jgi:hypothetical protein